MRKSILILAALCLIASVGTLLLSGLSTSSTNYGDTNIEPNFGSVAGNINAQAITVATGGKLTSISLYLYAGTGVNIQVGIYNDTGTSPNNYAGSLIANSASVAATVGWNTISFTGVTLSAGTYWLAFQDNGNGEYSYNNNLNKFIYKSNTFGTFPDPFPTSSSTAANNYISLYATVGGARWLH